MTVGAAVSTLAILDPAQAGWVSVLPDLSDLLVLKIGSRRAENIRTLARRSRSGLTCVGKPPEGALEGLAVRFVSALEHLGNQQFDVVILDEPELWASWGSNGSLTAAFRQLGQRIRDNGTLLVCLPDGMRNIPLRRRFRSILSKAGFGDLSVYACSPSAAEPLQITPASRDSIGAEYFPGNACLDGRALGLGALRDGIKRLAYRTLGITNPLFGVVIQGRKTRHAANGSASTPLCDHIRLKVLEHPTNTSVDLNVQMEMRSGSLRQYFFVRDAQTSELRAVAKLKERFDELLDASNAEEPVLVTEYKSTEAAYSIASDLEKAGIVVPAPIHLELSNATTLLISSAIPGRRADFLVNGYLKHDDRTELTDLLQRLATLQMDLQVLLSERVASRFPGVKQQYFDHPAPVLIDVPGFSEIAGAPWVQHGDLATVNLYRDDKKDRWGLIDWEWAASGYPPLFDTFMLIRSFMYLAPEDRGLSGPERAMKSLEASFFERNWFSEAVTDVLRQYCRRFEIPEGLVYACFLRYLQVMYNRVALSVQFAFHREMFEPVFIEALRRVVEWRGQFVLGSKP